MSRALKSKVSRNERKKVNKDHNKFGYKIPKNSMEALLLDKKNGNILWFDAISKEITELDRLVVFQFYPPNNNFEKKYGWKYAPMHMIFDVKHQDLQHKAGLVFGGHVMDSMYHTTYSSNIKYFSVRLMILIAVKNGLGIVAGYIGNAFYIAPCAENIWSCCGA